MNFDLLSLSLRSSIAEITQSTRRIATPCSETEHWYVTDVMDRFSSMFSHGYIPPHMFCDALTALDDYILVLNNHDINMSVLSKRNGFSRNVVDDIMARGSGSQKTSVEERKENYVFLSEVEEELSEFREGPIPAKGLQDHGTFHKSKDKASEPSITFDKIKSQIVRSFSEGFVIPVACFRTCFCKQNGIMFDYRKVPCNKYRHPHPTLTKYLKCCNDIVNITNFKSSYLFRKGQEITIEKRLLAHLKSRMNATLFPYHLELLSVNLFSMKTTLSLQDFLEVFCLVYKISFESCSSPNPVEAIKHISSPNFFVKSSKDQTIVTLIPSFDPGYVEYGNRDLQRSALNTERYCRSGIDSQDAFKASVRKNVSSTELFNISNEEINRLLDLADCNVPRCLQDTILSYDHEELRKFEMSQVWSYLHRSINFDGKRCFFDQL